MEIPVIPDWLKSTKPEGNESEAYMGRYKDSTVWLGVFRRDPKYYASEDWYHVQLAFGNVGRILPHGRRISSGYFVNISVTFGCNTLTARYPQSLWSTNISSTIEFDSIDVLVEKMYAFGLDEYYKDITEKIETIPDEYIIWTWDQDQFYARLKGDDPVAWVPPESNMDKHMVEAVYNNVKWRITCKSYMTFGYEVVTQFFIHCDDDEVYVKSGLAEAEGLGSVVLKTLKDAMRVANQFISASE